MVNISGQLKKRPTLILRNEANKCFVSNTTFQFVGLLPSNKASELGRIGGRNKRHLSSDTAEPLPTLDNPLAVRDAVARLIADVYAGRVHPKLGAGLAPLLHLQMRAIEAAEIERMARRLTKLEKQLAEVRRCTATVARRFRNPALAGHLFST